MTLVAPNLDDRGFQDLVDEAKRLVQQRCPEWTDHNVSDPGVTLIEAFATMVDQLIYRLNRVPDRHYVRFLDLLGLRPFPATAAHTEVTFWLSAPQRQPVTVPAGTEVATVRTEVDEAVVFSTVRPLEIVPTELDHVAALPAGGEPADQDEALRRPGGFACFQRQPVAGDALLIGLTAPVPNCALTVRVECRSEGVGVDPRDPPLVWEAWTAGGWAACGSQSDGTGGLNRPGDVVLHVPAGHVASVLGARRAGWVRCRGLAPPPRPRPYRSSPVVHALSCFTIGGTVAAAHAESVRGEVLGISDGSPGQRLPLLRGPVVPGDEPPVLQVSDGDGWQDWQAVESFAGRLPADEVFLLDHGAGQVELAPAVRERDGSLRGHGMVPPKGARLRLTEYRVGGGRRGNVAAGALQVLKSSVPYVARTENRKAAAGGVDGEEVANAVARGPLLLRTRDRAVPAADYEELTRQAAPQVERVRCVPATEPAEAGVARVLIVPAVGGDALGALRFDQLLPDEELLRRIEAFLGERRVVGTRVLVEPPYYRGVTVVARLTARPRADAATVERDALAALYRYLHPVRGGPAGTGWPFGRPVQAWDIFAVMQRVSGCELVEDVKLFPADPVEGQRGEATQRIDVPPHGLVHSYEHQVRVQG